MRISFFRFRLLAGFLIALTLASPGFSQEEASPEGKNNDENQQKILTDGNFTPYKKEKEAAPEGEMGLEERISLDLRNIEVTEALRFLAVKVKLNLAVSKAVSGRLMLFLNDVTVKDVLDIILLTNNLAYVKRGEIYHIMTEEEYKARYGRKFSDERKIKIFHLKYAIPDQVFTVMDALKSELGRVLVDQESGTALVMDTEENLARIEEAVTALEQKRVIRVFHLQYARAKDIEERFKPQLDEKKVGTIQADERSNQVIVQTLPERMEVVAQLIRTLDRRTKEVLIVSKIIKVSVNDDYNAEIKWEGFFQEFGFLPGTDFIGNHEFSPLARSGNSFLDDFVNIPPTTHPAEGSKNVVTENVFIGSRNPKGDNWELLFKYLRTIGDTKVLSSPRLTVVNNQEAAIHVGDREAYVTTTTTTGSQTNTTAEQVTFIDVGIKLSVTPTINDQGYVTMKIKPEISSVSRSLTTPSKNTIPIVDTSLAETTVMVKDGTSLIIAGLRRDDRTDSDKKVPYLSDIPVLGKIFHSYANTKKRTELLILLTPHIVTGDQLVLGEPGPVGQAIKPYQPYPPHKPLSRPLAAILEGSIVTRTRKKSNGSNAISGFFKKIFFLAHEQSI